MQTEQWRRGNPYLSVDHPPPFLEADHQRADQDAGGEEREGPPPGFRRRPAQLGRQVEHDAEDGRSEGPGGKPHRGLERIVRPRYAGSALSVMLVERIAESAV